MNSSCKLLSVSVALKKEGMSNNYLSAHHELISGIPMGEKRSVMVTFGLYARPGVPIGIYAAVTPKNQESPLGSNKYTESFYTTLRSEAVADDMGVFLMTLEVKDIPFEHDGLYEANVRIFPSEKMPSEDNQLDAIKCFFYVVTTKEGQHATNS
ncbi:hypothetical protein KBQ18_08285 [Klebsiella aerogenes]|uniref:hypothetical protein n=1 Tax=Klebsiella aerogenes TaxID=548 RepID=UPI0015EA956E|nr:hypothetical protein [Klebsiella aerogenes]MCT2785239.1 hypothetical protein [Klebsiella aerogenes]MCT2805459.1 hypothetical protein [Klebsiella aerogenes]MCT2811779.1 hypothetical protein [Klebsiella aerogenes]MCT2848256.1 hypothetical protein [Klebsiella aerogenes]QLS46443.1 hypothetical protein HV316_19770 [Klebsiella aerogenes]